MVLLLTPVLPTVLLSRLCLTLLGLCVLLYAIVNREF